MENANSDTKKSKLLIFMLVGLVVAVAAVGMSFYQSSQKTSDAAAEVETVDAEHKAESAEAPAKQSQQQKKPVAQKQSVAKKQESGSVMDKLKSIEVHGAKNPCTETQRMMKQCSD